MAHAPFDPHRAVQPAPVIQHTLSILVIGGGALGLEWIKRQLSTGKFDIIIHVIIVGAELTLLLLFIAAFIETMRIIMRLIVDCITEAARSGLTIAIASAIRAIFADVPYVSDIKEFLRNAVAAAIISITVTVLIAVVGLLLALPLAVLLSLVLGGAGALISGRIGDLQNRSRRKPETLQEPWLIALSRQLYSSERLWLPLLGCVWAIAVALSVWPGAEVTQSIILKIYLGIDP